MDRSIRRIGGILLQPFPALARRLSGRRRAGDPLLLPWRIRQFPQISAHESAEDDIDTRPRGFHDWLGGGRLVAELARDELSRPDDIHALIDPAPAIRALLGPVRGRRHTVR